jgi:hypothetical protein
MVTWETLERKCHRVGTLMNSCSNEKCIFSNTFILHILHCVALNRRDMLPQKDQSRPEHGRHEHTCTRDVHLFENKR